MAISVLIQFTTLGADTGPFNLYTNANGFTSAFASGVTKAQLLAGYASVNTPDGTTVVRVKSMSSACTVYKDLPLSAVTTTTSSTVIATTTTTTTIAATTTTSTLPMSYPVVDNCCGLTPGTHYVSAPLGTFVTGNVFSSTSFGYFGAFTVTGPMQPGIPDVVRYDSTIYGNCLEWSNIYAGNVTCV
jgi:hypothetical protein